LDIYNDFLHSSTIKRSYLLDAYEALPLSETQPMTRWPPQSSKALGEGAETGALIRQGLKELAK